MWVDNKEGIALSKVLLCAAFVACLQGIMKKRRAWVSGHSFDKRCLLKPSSQRVYYSQLLPSSYENVSLNNLELIIHLEKH